MNATAKHMKDLYDLESFEIHFVTHNYFLENAKSLNGDLIRNFQGVIGLGD